VARSLLRIKGEASAIKLAQETLQLYAAADGDGKRVFFEYLLSDLGPDDHALDAAVRAYEADPCPDNYVRLQRAVEPQRQELIRALNWAPTGTSALIDMRADLLELVDQNEHLKVVDHDFLHLLSGWFNRGFLEVRRISWETPAFILEKLIEYEAVHEIGSWPDLRRRLASDRRCFAFFHPQLPDEPLIFVEVALTKGLVANIRDVLEHEHPEDCSSKVPAPDTAIFYSINNCQKGLRGISFGNFLIKQVADQLAGEIQGLRHYATLSPIPGFRAWLEPVRAARSLDWLRDEDYETLAVLAADEWVSDAALADSLKPLMLKLCAHYLLKEKREDEPLDPVARFHLSNGARIERINWMGDLSEQRRTQSYGMLVNYIYDRRSVIRNHEDYVRDGDIAASTTISSLVR
jgi:malonyl-CoA decarboxylase